MVGREDDNIRRASSNDRTLTLSSHADLRPVLPAGRLRPFGRDGQAEEEGQGEEGASGGAGGGDYSP